MSSLVETTRCATHVRPLQAGMLSLALSAPFAAHASDFLFSTETEVPQIAGFAVGVVPDYLGSDDYTVGIAPFLRYQLAGTKRYVQLLGPELSLNMLNNEHWRVGPMLNYRAQRDHDVDDPVVSRMRSIDDTIELGGFVDWANIDANNPRKRFVAGGTVLSDVGGEHDGVVGQISARYWTPVAPIVDLNLSAGMMFADDDFTQTYFGVDAADAAASGLPMYSAEGGATDVRFTVGATVYLSKQWIAAGGIQYRRLLGDASDSPVVDQRGSADQVIGGVGFGYLW
jgi:outer membrane protein